MSIKVYGYNDEIRLIVKKAKKMTMMKMAKGE